MEKWFVRNKDKIDTLLFWEVLECWLSMNDLPPIGISDDEKIDYYEQLDTKIADCEKKIKNICFSCE